MNTFSWFSSYTNKLHRIKNNNLNGSLDGQFKYCANFIIEILGLII